jgi:hypothetical protein
MEADLLPLLPTRGFLCLLAACFMLVFYASYFLTLKLEAICSFETSVEFDRTTRRFIPEDKTLLNHLKSNAVK